MLVLSVRIGTHVRSNAVGYVALFIALGGTAWAANGPLAGKNTVGSSDIIKSEVKSADIAPNAVKSSDVATGAITAGDIANASSGSDAVNANTLDGLDAEDFAPGTDVHVSDRQKVNDPTPGDLGANEVTLFTSGSVSFVGECFDNQSLASQDQANLRVVVTGTGNGSVTGLTSTGDSIDFPTFGGSAPLGGAFASNASNSNTIVGADVVVVAPNGETVSATLSSEINDSDGGSTTDCAFAATGVG